ncbi:hypothetical protein LSH36_35g06011 [Paralvinella palmiformis]|uniref:Exocyst complex component 2 n=1 Tax=Paralvinella palmiformis TaxID=53620 RepID=A0AAD9NGZ5_9ANNE|nr:hypothetical protein LSH36_35g06011 [Paralvinella palmiformis]
MLSSVRRPVPQVTGISPKEGPPGTRVTIRGENLGISAQDLLALRICGVDCLLTAEWKSPNKIIARTGQAKGKGDIIVVTKSGGVGTCTVNYRGYNVQIGPLQESAIWIDETQTYNVMYRHSHASSPIASDGPDDPLGISDEANEKRFTEEQLMELFPEASGNTSLENFSPAWYLLENHHASSFEDLKAGLGYLKRKSSQQNEGPMAFVKGNLTTFLDCLDTLKAMNKKLMEDRQATTDGMITRALEDNLLKANTAADVLFHDVLGRKDRADATRNALGVLLRFKFLFNLPCSMERNIKTGNYDLVITDYTRAKSLFGDTDVPVFKKVYQEVENRIEGLREMLSKKLKIMPSSVEEQKRLIRYLVHLETSGEPAWDCLNNTQNWLLRSLHHCKEDYIQKDLEEERHDKEKLNPLSPMTTAQVMRQTGFKASNKAPQKVLFIDHLTRTLCEYLPDLWRLGQSYFSGKLLKEVLILEVVNLYSNLVRAAFLPATLKKVSVPERAMFGTWPDKRHETPIAWLPLCVRHVRACLASLSSFDLPTESIDVLQKLTFDVRWNCLETLLKQATKDIRSLEQSECWSVDTDDERGGTTKLPTMFENLVNETIQHLQEVVQTRTDETELFTETEDQKHCAELWIEVLQVFATTLDQLAITGNGHDSKQTGKVILPQDHNKHWDATPSLDRRLVIMMGNCSQTVDNILPRLIETLSKHGYPETGKIRQATLWCFKNLDIRLFDKYIEEKAGPVIGVLEQNMYQGKFDWASCPQPTGVRNYLKEAIMGMIEIQAEVYSVSPNFVERVMFRVIESVTDEISRLFQCVTNFDHQGALQAHVDLRALEVTIGGYKTQETRNAIKEALSCVPEIKTGEDKNLLYGHFVRFLRPVDDVLRHEGIHAVLYHGMARVDVVWICSQQAGDEQLAFRDSFFVDVGV